jgi:hypothetical protein
VVPEGFRVRLWATYSQVLQERGALAHLSPSRSLREADCDPECAWPKPASKQHCSFTNNPAYRKTREFRLQEELLFESAQDAARLTHMRYSGGVTGYLEVLTNETNAFSAELAVVQARQNELLALVQLYEALGGGWQQ